MVLAVLALLSPARGAGPRVLPPNPGLAGRDNVVRVVEAPPGSAVWLAVGAPGATPMPGCPGVTLAITSPGRVGPRVADASGEATFAGYVALSRRGRDLVLQAVLPATCTVGPPRTWTPPVGTELPLQGAYAVFVGESPFDQACAGVAFPGDLDGDGRGEIALGTRMGDAGLTDNGAVYVASAPMGGVVRLADLPRLRGEAADDRAGYSVAGAGDVDGDGLADLIVGAHQNDAGGNDAGAAYLVTGPVTADGDLADAHARMRGEAPNSSAGDHVSPAGDHDGDGVADILVGAPDFDLERGLAYLVLGPVAGEVGLGAVGIRLVGSAAGGRAGRSVTSLDANADGSPDILLGAPMEGAGAAYLLYGPVTADRSLATADARMAGEGTGDEAGVRVASAGDVDGDGADDLLIGARFNDDAAKDAGAAYLVEGATLADGPLAAATARLRGEAQGDLAGVGIASAGDQDGDGFADVIVGARYNRGAGSAYLLLGPLYGEVELESAEVRFRGDTSQDLTGYGVAGGADLDGDGSSEILVNAWQDDRGGQDAGAAYLVSGATLGL